MATSVVLLHYNNYFNRQVKRLGLLPQYLNADSNAVICNNINFVPGDGINTSLVLGKGTNPGDIFTGAKDGFDYLVVFDPSAQDTPIISRWFVIETHKTREGQYDIRLRRDVVADHYDEIVNSPMYIEKGYINDINNPLLYNHESLSVNQIKEKEIPIKDNTECGWVVGYIPRDANPGTVKSSAVFRQSADITVANLSDWNYWDYCDFNSDYKSVAQINARKEIYFHLSSMYQNRNNFW